MAFRPINDRIVVKRNQVCNTTPGGIVLTPTAKQKSSEGVVLATGPGSFDNQGNLIAMDVFVGDRVVFAVNSGFDFDSDGQQVTVINRGDIIAVLGQEDD